MANDGIHIGDSSTGSFSLTIDSIVLTPTDTAIYSHGHRIALGLSTPVGGVGVSNFLNLTDTPVLFTADYLIKVNGGGAALEWQNPATYNVTNFQLETTLAGYTISDTKANFNTGLSDGVFIFASDTAAMLLPYALLVEAILPEDTAAMLTPYARLVEAILPADTAAMLLPYALLVEAILPADTAAMLTPYALLTEAILPADTAAMLSTYVNNADTAAMLLPYALLTEAILPADTAAMLAPYALLVEAILPADTAAMLLPYALLTEAILPGDTAAMLLPYALLTEAILPADTAAMLVTYITRSDTADMLTPYALLSEAGEASTLLGLTDVNETDYTDDGLKILRVNVVEDAVEFSDTLDAYVNEADTTSMLANYAELTEVILPADTAAMLSNYAELTEVILPADTAAMLTPYALLSEAPASHDFDVHVGDVNVTSIGSWDAGKLIYGGAVDWTTLAAGTNTYVLKMGATLPDWGQVAFSELTSTPTTLSGYGISDTKANFNTRLSDGSFAFDGGAHHDGFSDFVAAEHYDLSSDTHEWTTTNDINADTVKADVFMGAMQLFLQTSDAEIVLTAAQVNNAIHINNDDDVISFALPDASLWIGKAVIFKNADFDRVITVESADGDVLLLYDTSLTAGDATDSAGTAGEVITIISTGANSLVTIQDDGPWVDGGTE